MSERVTLSTTGAATLNSAGVTNNLTVGGVTQLNGTNGLQFDAGQNVSEISTDGTLVDNSNTALPTEQAVKTYVDAQVGKSGSSRSLHRWKHHHHFTR